MGESGHASTAFHKPIHVPILSPQSAGSSDHITSSLVAQSPLESCRLEPNPPQR